MKHHPIDVYLKAVFRFSLRGDGPLDFAVLRRRGASARTLLALGATLASCSSQVGHGGHGLIYGGFHDAMGVPQ